MEILHQLGDLFIEAVPTVVIVFLFYLFMRWAFFGPITAAMAQRSAKIEGARKEAAEVEAAAKHELENYQESLRRARAEIYAEQEAERQAVLEERSKLLKAMRNRAQEEVDIAKRRLALELASAKGEMEKESTVLAGQIARSILERPEGPRSGARR